MTTGLVNNIEITMDSFFTELIQKSQIWCLSLLCVAGAMMPHQLFAQPSVNLGADTVLCGGSLLLDAENTGSTYLWSTGAVSQTVTVSVSDTIWVEVANGTGTSRDSIIVVVLSMPSDPVVTDTTICGSGTLNLVGTTTGDNIFWYDAPSGGSFLGGDTLNVEIQTSTSYYAAGVNSDVKILGAPDLPALGPGIYSNANNRGVKFDAYQNLTIKSIDIYAQGTTTFDIELRNSSNAVLETKTFTVPDGLTRVPVWFSVPQGNAYALVGMNISTGKLFLGTGVASLFPVVVPGLGSVYSGFSSATRYGYFFAWEVIGDNASCASPLRSQLDITTASNPIVDLGNDTILCGGTLALDVTNPGAIYSWHEGSTGPTLTLTASDTAFVTVAIGNCTESDTLVAVLNPTPSDPVVLDTTLCGPGSIQLSGSTTGETVFWFDSLTGGSFLAGDTLGVMVSNTTVFYATGVYTAPQMMAAPDTAISTGSGLYFSADNRGVRFDAYKDLIIKSIEFYAEGQTTFEIELKNSSNVVLQRKTLTVPDGKSRPIIWFSIPQGNGYSLVGKNFTQGKLHMNTSVSNVYPIVAPGLGSIYNGFSSSSRYGYFYNWEVVSESEYCEGAMRIPLQVNIAPNPEIELGNDTVLCNTSVLLDASFPGATYLWQDSSTNPTLLVSATDTLLVQASIGNCVTIDSVIVTVFPIPSAPILNDTTLCGPDTIQLTGLSSGDRILWYDSLVGGRLVDYEEMIDIYIPDTTVLYLQGVNSVEQYIGAPDNNFNGNKVFLEINDRGLTFDVFEEVILQSVSVYGEGGAFSTSIFDIELRDANDSVLRVMTATIPDGKSRVPLWWNIPPGSGYKIVGIRITQGKFNINTSVDLSIYPFEIPGVISITGNYPTLTHYSYFFDWEISNANSSCSSNRVPVEVIVEVPLDLVDSVYSCTDYVIDAGLAGNGYAWSTGETSQSIVVTETGLYEVAVSTLTGCLVEDSIFVEIPQGAGLPDDGILCGTTLETNYGSESTFLWSTGDMTSSINLTNAGTYSVIVNEPRGCTLFDTVVIAAFDAFPVVNLGPDFAQCVQATLDLGNPGMSYHWSNGDTTQMTTVTASGSYIGTVTNTNGCATSDTISVLVEPVVMAQFSFSFATDFQVFFNNLSFPFSTYFWDFGDGTNSTFISPSHTYADTGSYVVRLIATNQCGSDTLEQTINVIDTSVGIGDSFSELIQVFPNPAESVLNIRFAELLSEGALIQLIDVKGSVIMRRTVEIVGREHQESLWVNEVPSGMYLLVIQMGKEVRMGKVIIH